MKIDIIMPKMGESVTEGTIIKWHKKVGDTIKKDEIIFEISTDKVDTEIPAPENGILSEILVQEQETVAVNVVVARLSKSSSLLVNSSATISAAELIKSVVEESTTTEYNVTEEQETADLIDIPMPKMGESVMEGTIIKWYKRVGDKVKKDETFFEISTDKVDTEITSPEDGFVVEILVSEQETVSVGTVVARISSTLQATVSKPSTIKEIPKPIEASLAVSTPIFIHDIIGKNIVTATPLFEKTEFKDRFYSPLVMSIAQKEGVSVAELNNIEGTGNSGRVSKNDVLNYIENRKKQPSIPKPVEQAPVYSPSLTSKPVAQSPKYDFNFSSGETEIIPMDNIRKKIMEHMVISRDTSVHVTEIIEVDMSKIYRFMHLKKDDIQKSEGVKLTYMPFIAHTVVRALREYPLVNSSIDGNNIIQKKFVNLGIAVSVPPNGLIVPNIKNAQDKNIVGLAKSITDVALRARNRKLSPDDITGGTFTITNYGVFGSLFGTPIINQPEVAILGVGVVVKRAVVIEVDGMDTIAIKPMMYLTLSHDHRLVDGMLGGLFLKSIKENLENFNENLVY